MESIDPRSMKRGSIVKCGKPVRRGAVATL